MINRKLLFALIIIGIILRVLDINWGSPFYFHPDERNIANSVLGLSFPNQMNPHFFAYGSLPIYLILSISQLLNFVSVDKFAHAIVASRILSLACSVFIIPSVLFIGQGIFNKKVGYLSAIFSVFSVGYIQFAHFGTFEMLITLLTIWYFYSCYKLSEEVDNKWIFLTGLIFGLLISVKLSNLTLILLPTVLIFLRNKSIKPFYFLSLLQITTLALIVFAITNPFTFLDFNSFKGSINYESSVALGTLPVFYTQSFLKTLPIIYQLTSIFPFLINPFFELIFLLSFITSLATLIIKFSYRKLVLISAFLIVFIPQAILFVKWTRYMVPIIPFIIFFVSDLLATYSNTQKLKGKFLTSLLILISVLYSVFFVKTTYLKADPRIIAAYFSSRHVGSEANVASEVYDLGIVPFNRYLRNIILINFYDLENITDQEEKNFYKVIKKKDFIIIPSERIYKTRLNNSTDFPRGNKFYSLLFNGNLGFKEIYASPCDLFCNLIFATDKIFPIEQTARVFDDPNVLIFKNEQK